MFIDVFEKECEKRGVSPSFVCDKVGITRASLKGWREGAAPRESNISKIAEYFGVSSAYMLGIPDVLPIRVGSMNKEESELLRIYKSLDTKGKTLLLAYAYKMEEDNGKQ